MPKCKNCGDEFKPVSFNRKYCIENPCNDKYYEELQKKALKKWNKEKKAKKEELKTVSDLMKEAQKAFNAFIRERDKNKPCISCNRLLVGKFDAGHYFSSGGHKNVTFHEDNVHAQCVFCNRHMHGNLIEYQIGIEKRIGADRLFYLHQLAHQEYKPSREQVKEIIKEYKQKLKTLKNKR